MEVSLLHGLSWLSVTLGLVLILVECELPLQSLI